jgi:hypothetical protein
VKDESKAQSEPRWFSVFSIHPSSLMLAIAIRRLT